MSTDHDNNITATGPELTENQRLQYEAAAFRTLVEHLRNRTDVQNIDMMNLAGFCRNCLSNWYQDAAEADGQSLSKQQARSIIYGMPYDEWRQKHQKPASAGQIEAFNQNNPENNK